MMSDAIRPERIAVNRLLVERIRIALSSQSVALLLVLLALCIFFSVQRPDAFPRPANIANMATDASILLILAVGGTFVILTSGIDLSINGVIVFAGVIAAKTMSLVGGEGAMALLAGLFSGVIAGAFWGLLNGFLVAKANIPPLIVTLGTMGMSLGIALLLTNGIDISDVPYNLVETVGSGRVFGAVPVLVIITGVVFTIGALILAYTRFGRFTYAVGSNPEACRRVSINVAAHLIKVYVLAGALTGFAGYLSLARFATTTLGGHTSDNLQVIAAIVIGGTSLFGGAGTLVGTLIGICIPVVLLNGFVVLGLPPFWQQVSVGAVLIGAVYLDQLRRRSRDQ